MVWFAGEGAVGVRRVYSRLAPHITHKLTLRFSSFVLKMQRVEFGQGQLSSQRSGGVQDEIQNMEKH